MAGGTGERVPRRYGTFEGVFTPTLLTILGVIMFLRLGWVVGNGGLGGAWLIIAISFLITGFTSLSLASLTTNIRIGAGGAYSLIAQSLGLEVAGSIGIPLYVSQALAVSMYVFGFREGWRVVFPGHSPLLVDLLVFAVLFGIAYASAGLAFRVQFGIMALIGASLAVVLVAALQGSMRLPVEWWGPFSGGPEEPGGFWLVFAVFFPAATGIMAGANLSGELRDPRRSIPIGTLAAVGVSFAIYMALAYWLARSATAEELLGNFTIMVDLAAWGPAVLGGLLGATFSSGLASIVGAPRILQALGSHRVLPTGAWLARPSRAGEPRNAMVVTALIVLAALMLRDLNTVAPLITMFFLITYAMVNVVVLVEQSLGLVSFRPLFRIPWIVPLVGGAGCVFAMFVVNPVFGLVAVAVVLTFYGYLTRRHLQAPFGDVRSGLFVALAEWAAKKVARLSGSQERAWKPNLLAPVEDAGELRGSFRLIHAITFPRGSLKLVGLDTRQELERLAPRLQRIADGFEEEGVFGSVSLLTADRFGAGFVNGIEALAGAFFRPNLVFLTSPEDSDRAGDVRLIVSRAHAMRMGVLIFAEHPQAGLGRRHWVNLWLPEWRLVEQPGPTEADLAILVAYKLLRNWRGRLRLLSVVGDTEEKESAQRSLSRFMNLARLPGAEVYAMEGDMASSAGRAPQADLNLIPFSEDPDFEQFGELVVATRSSCLFVWGSGEENALA